MTEPLPLLDVVLFDIDDTLYSTTEFARHARQNAIEAMVGAGLAISVADGYDELSEVVAEFSSNYADHFGRLLDRLGPAAYEGRNPVVIVAAGVVAYHETRSRMRLQEDAKEVLEALKAAGVRLGVISAGLKVKQAEKLIRLGAIDYFDPTAIFFSDQMGVSKPNPKIFQKAVDAIGVDATRALYVGDRPTHDIVPARSIGMKTVQYTGTHGRHADSTEDFGADHVLEDMRVLLPILRERYALPLAAS